MISISFSEVNITFIVTAGLILALNPIAIKFGLVNQPDSRKLHSETPAMIGGVAIWFGLFIFYGVASSCTWRILSAKTAVTEVKPLTQAALLSSKQL
ncbi:MAG: UDP-N-acetylmuramyl pentapeptide phosphotransferase/UDP-N-acetylglucosamine-1-phosphate transferase [Arenicella sp.]|jgi:UDP-N-acetylmuramyl pentapeptide phosphotransferase/UDP-N-acetylglucosamine-1-phosphate transferase